MEVDKTAFWGRLLDILEAISTAHFVSFDLELSGIPSKTATGAKQTLEERYQEIKAAADRYQILQIGLTCVEQDVQAESYVLRPYNFNLNPLLEERLDIERIWSFQSGAAEFLLSVGFKMDLPMTRGVPYLSREEAKEAKKLAYARWDRTAIADVQLKEDEVQSLEFVSRVRSAIDTWKDTGKPFASHLNIVSTNPLGTQPTYPDLGNFEKRLVHQLVRAEYPELVTISKPQAIQVVPLNVEREKEILRRKKKMLRHQIERQTGFRWIIEALCGGKLDIEPDLFARDVHTGAVKSADMIHLKARFDRARLALQRTRPVLVGHNLFTDIIYLYRTFIGSLPLTIEQFREALHENFPVVVDTKYLATHNCGDLNPKSSLLEIHLKLHDQSKPTIVTHSAHDKYHIATPLHEAGYDSFLTALIMIRLSTKLEEAGTYRTDASLVTSDDEAYETAPEPLSDRDGSPPLPGSTRGILTLDGGTELITPAIKPEAAGDRTKVTRAVAPLADTEDPAQAKKSSRKKKKNKGDRPSSKTKPTTSKTQTSRFFSANMFDQLSLVDEDAAESEGDEVDADAGSEEPRRNGSPTDDDQTHAATSYQWDGTTYYSYDKDEGVTQQRRQQGALEREASEPMTAMPPFDTGFWRVYGNKLRVFGTTESAWKLRP